MLQNAESVVQYGCERVLEAPAHTLINVHVRGEAMTSIDSTHELIPVKHCNTCGKDYPATTEYFYRHACHPDGFRSQCKNCIRQYNKNYRESDPEKYSAFHKKYYAKSRGYRKPIELSYRLSNKHQKQRYDAMRYEKKKDHVKTKVAEWRVANPEARRAIILRYEGRKHGAEGTHTTQDILRMKKVQRGKCYYCGCKLTKYHVDHVIPLSRGGSNDPSNLVLACPSCNTSKGDRLPSEWIKGGKLL